MSGLETTDKQGRWFVMSVIKIWDLCIEVFLRSLFQMWSMIFWLLYIILVGFVIRGLNEHEVKMF